MEVEHSSVLFGVSWGRQSSPTAPLQVRIGQCANVSVGCPTGLLDLSSYLIGAANVAVTTSSGVNSTSPHLRGGLAQETTSYHVFLGTGDFSTWSTGSTHLAEAPFADRAVCSKYL